LIVFLLQASICWTTWWPSWCIADRVRVTNLPRAGVNLLDEEGTPPPGGPRRGGGSGAALDAGGSGGRKKKRRRSSSALAVSFEDED